VLPFLTREQSRELDQKLIAAGVPSVLLMENAGRGAADVIARELPRVNALFVVCGPGNNGGDGFVLARRWLTLGKPVKVHLHGAVVSLSPDARVQYLAYLAVCGQLVNHSELTESFEEADAVVDALFGTGLSRPTEGAVAELIRRINRQPRPVIALDLPSGLDANTGAVLGECVRATLCVSFGTAKRGCFTVGGAKLAGKVHTVDIGAPLPLAELGGKLAVAIDRARVRDIVADRTAVGHKGQAGHVVVVAGSQGTLGAARLAAHGAFRAGAGVVTIATHADAVVALSSETWEVMVRAIGPHAETAIEHWASKASSVVFGPGLGATDLTASWLETLLTGFRGTVVLDADGLTLLAGNPTLVERSVAQLVMTPHPGEAARLLGASTSRVEADRFGALEQLCERYRATVVLKGAPSLVGDSRLTYVSPSGHPCLSTAGSGDVLAGVIGALSAQVTPLNAALAGSWLHATAGEQLGSGGFAGRGLLAREIADRVPDLCTALMTERATAWQGSEPT
jgi:hydroxyethylthiazole kinase-like uncharacterized protein yjeF